jgi:hypothetical protein
MPDFWLEVSLHLEDPATDQLDQGPRANAELVPKFHIDCILHVQLRQLTLKISLQCTPPNGLATDLGSEGHNYKTERPFPMLVKV